MRTGDLDVTVLEGGSFHLDGGAMHGVVPKTLWSELVSCDEHNRCEYATRCLLVQGRGHRVLVETGNGDKFSPRLREIYGISHGRSVVTALREQAIDPESVDTVVMSHLHFDHSGGATRRGPVGALVPTFPRARHVVQEREWQDALHPHERNRASYLPDNYLPLEAAGLLALARGEEEVAPGIRVLPTPGHTAGHQSILIGDPGDPRLLLLGDIVPTQVHVKLPWLMAYDLDPVGTLETKRALLARAAREGWIVVFGHDAQHAAARLALDEKGVPRVSESVDLS
jgi:glyoxylase-like metal-dependent hydrolase (beta-lactamase superfamily II)